MFPFWELILDENPLMVRLLFPLWEHLEIVSYEVSGPRAGVQ